jgi:hypothetical protein
MKIPVNNTGHSFVQRCMRILLTDTPTRYGLVSILMHWVIALAPCGSDIRQGLRSSSAFVALSSMKGAKALTLSARPSAVSGRVAAPAPR